MNLTIDSNLNLAVSAELLANEAIRVHKGSEALRNRRKRNGQSMVDRGERNTAAADVVFGANKSGREFWRSSINGKSLVELFGPAR